MMRTRQCFLEPPPEVWTAAEHLLEAVRMHHAGDWDGAVRNFRQANSQAIGSWFNSVVGAHRDEIHGPRPIQLEPPRLPLNERSRPRMLNVVGKRQLLDRDGFHCRFCGMPVILKDTIKSIAKAYPADAPWSGKAAEQHCFFKAANLQFDHILPHSRGGETNLSNMVVTCAVCNYGRSSNTLEESFLLDPRQIPVRRSHWDGLQNFVRR